MRSFLRADGHRWTILVAAAAALLRKKLVLILREAGFRVEEAEDGIAALAQARIERPDLIFMGYMMPGMDGVEAIRKLRRDDDLHNVPVLLLTTHQKIHDVQRALDCDVQGFLAKPFDPVGVHDKLHDVRPRTPQTAPLRGLSRSDWGCYLWVVHPPALRATSLKGGV